MLDRIEDALEDLRAGKVIIVVYSRRGTRGY